MIDVSHRGISNINPATEVIDPNQRKSGVCTVRNIVISEDKFYHPSLTFECGDVAITIKFDDLSKLNVEAIVAPCIANDRDHKHTTRISKFIGRDVHDVNKMLV